MEDTNYTQICVWSHCELGDSNEKDFADHMLKCFGIRANFLEDVITLPDKDENGNVIEGTGGRFDLFFSVHSDDISKWAIPRLTLGIRWWEDVLASSSDIYPQEVKDKYPPTWNQENIQG